MMTQPKALRLFFAGWPLPIVLCVSLFLTSLLGYLDYLTGYDKSLLLFYLVPIVLVTWFGSATLGIVFSILAVVTWIFSDVLANAPCLYDRWCKSIHHALAQLDYGWSRQDRGTRKKQLNMRTFAGRENLILRRFGAYQYMGPVHADQRIFW